MNNNSGGRIVMLALILVVGGGAALFLGNKFFWTPYRDSVNRLESLQAEVNRKDDEKRKLDFDMAAMAKKFNKLSLPANVDRATADYGNMLKKLLKDSGLVVEDMQGPPPQEAATMSTLKKTKHIVLPFTVRAKGTIDSLSKTLVALQRTPVMHRVKSLLVDRVDAKDKSAKLGVQMTIEAVIVNGANNQPSFGSLKDLDPPSTTRKYQDVALRNPFLGLVPVPISQGPATTPEPTGPNVLEFIHIDTIVTSAQEAFLRNRLYNKTMRLRSKAMSGYDTFAIKDDNGKYILKGKVLRIDERDIYFQVKDVVHRIHFGQSLAEAMNRSLNDEQIEALELTAHIDPDFGSDDPALKKSAQKGEQYEGSGKVRKL